MGLAVGTAPAVDVRLGDTTVAAVYFGEEKVWPVGGGGETGAPPVPGYAAWWDFSDSASLTVSGSEITTAADKSGNGWDLSRGAHTGPALTTSTELGHGTLTHARFTRSEAMYRADDMGLGATFTVFAVGRKQTASQIPYDGDYLWRTRKCAVFVTGPNLTMFTDGNYATASTDPADWTTSGAFVTEIGGAAANATWLNDTLKISGAGNPSAPESLFTVGNYPTLTSDWDVGEVIVYPSVLATAARQAVTQYLMTKWGIADEGGAEPPSGCVAWWDFSDEATLTLAGDRITSVAPKAGTWPLNADGPTQPTSATSPLLGGSTMKTAAFSPGGWGVLVTNIATSYRALTVCWVSAKQTSGITSGSNDLLLDWYGNGVYLNGDPLELSYWVGRRVTVSANPSDWTDAHVHCYMIDRDATIQYRYWIDGVEKNSGSGIMPDLRQFRLGASENNDTDFVFGEVLLYDGTNPPIADITTYLRMKWGIA